MPRKKIVLDTNCLLVSISKYGEAYPVWHFNILRDITFLQLLVLRLKEFLESLQKEAL